MPSLRPLALVTGASGGIGEAFADLLSTEGYDLLLVARRLDALESVAARARAKGGMAEVLAADLTEPGCCARVVSWAQSHGRPLDLLVNNAGYGLMAPVGAPPLGEELGVVDLNVRALTELTSRFLPDLKARQGGVINISSLIAYQPMPYFTLYAASKAYVQTYSRMLAKEVKRDGVTVLAVCPGYTATGFQARAGAIVGALDRFVPKHSPEKVARDGWRAFQRGRRVHVVGIGNWLVAHLGFVTAPMMTLVSRKAYQMAQDHQANERDK